MEIENQEISISYRIDKCKGDKATPPSRSIVVDRVEIWCEALSDWLDVTEIESQELDKYVIDMINNQQGDE